MKKYTLKTNVRYTDKILAIKVLRQCTGMGLVDSKNAVEDALYSPTEIQSDHVLAQNEVNNLYNVGLTVAVAKIDEHYVSATLRKLAKRVLDENDSPVIAEKVLGVLNELTALGLLTRN